MRTAESGANLLATVGQQGNDMFADLKVWLDHFMYHAQRTRRVPDGVSDKLSEAETRAIADSIATFQLGEQSSGRSLLNATRRFAVKHDVPQLVHIIELFIREEQHHATLLREFMQSHSIPLKTSAWTDHAFRLVRRLAGFELYLTVLITAELLGNVYYRALEVATGCQRLRVLCRMMVADELAHIGLQSELLLTMRSQRPQWVQTTTELLHRSLLFTVSFVVWYTHRPVLKRAGYRMSTFMRACHAQYAFYLCPPRIYAPAA